MADPTIPTARLNEELLAEAIRQIGRLSDLLSRGTALGPAFAPPLPLASSVGGTPVSGGSPPISGFSGLSDVTNYTFRAPPAVGSRLTVRTVSDVGVGEQLRATGQAYAHVIGDLLGAEDLVVSSVDTLPDGSEYVVVTGRLPAESGQAGGAAVLRSAFVRLASGPVNVEFVSRANDPEAEAQFGDVLRTIRSAPATDPVAAAFESVTGSVAGPSRQAGQVAFDLPPVFRGPAAATFASPDRQVRFEVALAEAGTPEGTAAAPSVPGDAFVGTLASATGDDGRPLLYEMAPSGPAAPSAMAVMGAGAGTLPPITVAHEVTQEVELNCRRLRVTGVAEDNAAAQNLVREALDRVRPRSV